MANRYNFGSIGGALSDTADKLEKRELLAQQLKQRQLELKQQRDAQVEAARLRRLQSQRELEARFAQQKLLQAQQENAMQVRQDSAATDRAYLDLQRRNEDTQKQAQREKLTQDANTLSFNRRTALAGVGDPNTLPPELASVNRNARGLADEQQKRMLERSRASSDARIAESRRKETIKKIASIEEAIARFPPSPETDGIILPGQTKTLAELRRELVLLKQVAQGGDFKAVQPPQDPLGIFTKNINLKLNQ